MAGWVRHSLIVGSIIGVGVALAKPHELPFRLLVFVPAAILVNLAVYGWMHRKH